MIERRKNPDRRISPAIGDFALEERAGLLEQIAQRDARIAELEAESAEWSPVMQRLGDENQSLRAALKSQQSSAGVVLPDDRELLDFAVSVPAAMPERWEDRLSRMHQTIPAGCWPKRWVDDAKDYELNELRALLAQMQEVKS